MSSCIKELYDYDLVKQCCRCKSTYLKSNFNKSLKRKDGVKSMCKVCMNNYKKEHMEKRLKTDVNFRLI